MYRFTGIGAVSPGTLIEMMRELSSVQPLLGRQTFGECGVTPARCDLKKATKRSTSPGPPYWRDNVSSARRRFSVAVSIFVCRIVGHGTDSAANCSSIGGGGMNSLT